MSRSRLARLFVVVVAAGPLVAAAGCNLIFGLDETSLAGGDGGGGGDDDPDGAAGADASGHPADARADADPADPDRDGDKVADDEDNCPERANNDQNDEDGDGPGDVCDNCPHVGNPDQTNDRESDVGSLPDEVGDDCDPYPATGHDKIALFDGFGGAQLASHWLATGGTATVSDGVLHLSSTGGDTVLVSWEGPAEAQVFLEAPSTVTAILDDPSTTRSVGAGVRYSPGVATPEDPDPGPFVYLCEVFDAPGNAAPAWHVLGRLVNGVGGTTFGQENLPAGVTLVASFIHRIRAVPRVNNTGTDVTCLLDAPGADPPSITGVDALLEYGGVALRSRGLAVEVPYVVVFDRE